MVDADDIFNTIGDELTDRDKAREEAIKASRDVIRMTKDLIRDIHGGKDVGDRLGGLDGAVKGLREAVSKHPPLANSGLVESALTEAVETHIFWSVVKRQALPTPEAIGVTPTSYLLGAADAVGELRRWFMTALLNDDMEEARRTFDAMENLYDQLNRLSFPDAVVPLRHKQDMVRGMLERTRATLVEAVEKRR